MTLAKSAVTHAFFGYARNTEWVGTVIKAWIKDAHTICLEKFIGFGEDGKCRVWFCSMFATRGHRSLEFDLLTKSPVSLKHDGPIGYISNATYIETEHYVFLAFTTGGLSWNYKGLTDKIYNYKAFPSNIHVKLPYVFGGFDSKTMFAILIEVEWDGENINVPELPSGYGSGTGYDPVFYAFAVRDGVTETTTTGDEGGTDDNVEAGD